MDRNGADFYRTVKMIGEKLAAKTLILQLPWGNEEKFKGIIDLIKMKAFSYTQDDLGSTYEETEIPIELMEKAKKYRHLILENLAEYDESIMEAYVHEKNVENETIYKVIRKATLDSDIFPVLCGTALKNKGIQLLLDATIDYLPSPNDIPPVKGKDPSNDKGIVRLPENKEPFAGLVFKIMTDPFIGKLSFIRVYSGTLKSGTYIYNPGKDIKERVNRLVVIHADHREDVKELHAGDLGAIIGLKKSTTGDTICDDKKPIVLESMKFPEPVISIAIEPKSKAEQDKMAIALDKLSEEDPTFIRNFNPDTGQTIISGMGELHLEIIIDRLFSCLLYTSPSPRD